MSVWRVLLVSALVLVACGGGDSGGGTAPTTATVTPAPTSTAIGTVGTTEPATTTTEAGGLDTSASGETTEDSVEPEASVDTNDLPETADKTSTTAAATSTTVADPGHRGLVWASGVDPSRVNASDVPQPVWEGYFTRVAVDLVIQIDAQTDPTSELTQNCHGQAALTGPFNPPTCLFIQLRMNAAGEGSIGATGVQIYSDKLRNGTGEVTDLVSASYGDAGFTELIRGNGDQVRTLIVPNATAGGEMSLGFSECNDDYTACAIETIVLDFPDTELRPLSFS